MSNTNPFLQSPLDALSEPKSDAPLSGLPDQPKTDTRQPAPKADNLLPPDQLRPLFETTATKYDVPVNVLMALGHQESRYKASAVGTPTQWGRAKGMMQYLDSTAEGMGINPFDPAQSIDAAAKQIRERLDKGYSMDDAVKEHFAGPDRNKWGPKTEVYGREVMDKAGRIGEAFGASTPQQPDLQAQLDQEEPGRYRVMSPSEVDETPDQQAPAPAQEDGSSWFADMGKMLVGGAYKGVGSTVRGIGAIPQIIGEYTTTPLINKIFGTNYRTGNLMDTPANAAKGYGEKIQGGVSDETKTAIKDSTPDGDIFKPSTWTFGDKPSLRGYTALSAEVFGQMLPVVAATFATGGASNAVRMTTTGAAGGAQGGGAGIEQAREVINKMAETKIGGADGQSVLERESSYYRDLRQQGLSHEEAVTRTSDAAERLAFMMTAPVSAVGGMLTGKLINPAEKILSGQNLATRIAGRGALAVTEEGTQEVIEGVQTKRGINTGAGTNVDVTEGSFGDFVLGAVGGGGMGSAAGALSTRETGTAPEPTETTVTETGQEIIVSRSGNVEVRYPAPSQAPGPLTRSAENATAPVQESRVTVTAPEGNITGFMESYQQDADGNYTARVLGDDGQSYTFNSADGVTIAPEAGPLTKAIDQVAQSQPQPVADTQPFAEPVAEAAPVTEPQALANPEPAATPAPLAVADMDDAQLRERMKYIADQAKTNGGMNKMLTSARKEIEREINRRAQEVQDGQADDAPGVPVRDVSATGNQDAAQQQRSGQEATQQAEVPAGTQPAGAEVLAPAAGAGVPGADLPANQQPALKKPTKLKTVSKEDADRLFGVDKKRSAAMDRVAKGTAFFGTQQKAGDFIAKNGLKDTHEVKQTGKVRFEVQPKEQTNGNDQRTNQQPDGAEEVRGQEGKAKNTRSKTQKVAESDNGVETTEAVEAETEGSEAPEADVTDKATKKQQLAAASNWWDGRSAKERGDLLANKYTQAVADGNKRLAFDELGSGMQTRIVELLAPQDAPAEGTTPADAIIAAYKKEGSTDADATDMAQEIQKRADRSNKAMTLWLNPDDGELTYLPASVANPFDQGVAVTTVQPVTAQKKQAPATEPAEANLAAAKALMDEQKAATGNAKAEAAVRKKARDLASKTPITDEKTVLALDMIATRLGMGDDGKKALDFATAAEPTVLKAAKELGKVEIINVGDKKPADNIFANNKIFTADKVEAARARMKSKFGQINSGIDPEMMIDGMTVAGAYIESGVREFSAYAKALVADFGDGVKPYLLSFYEGARNYPGLKTEGMSSVDEAKSLHAEMLKPADVQTEAVGELVKKPAKRTKKTGAKSDMTLTQDWGVDAINGYSDDFNRETGSTVKDAFLKEARGYLTTVAAVLAEQGYTPHTDAKGRPEKSVSVNESGVAGSGEVSLTLSGPDGVGVYAQISETSLRGVVPTTQTGIAILFRTATDKDKFGSGVAGSSNKWMPVDLSAADLAAMMDNAVKASVPKPAKAPTINDQEKPNDTEPSDQDVGNRAEGSPAEGLRTDAGGQDAGGLPQQTGRTDPGTERGSASRTGQRPTVPENRGSNAQGAGSQQPAQGGRGSRTPASDRGSPKPGSLNYRVKPGELKREGSWRQTAERNVEIVELIKRIDAEGRPATEAERATMVKFTGWGASEIANGVFPDRFGRFKDNFWQGLGERLKAAMTPEEYDQAKRTTQYAHYTSEGVIRSIYTGLDRLGFKGGTVMEPGMGTGLFNGLMPDGMAANTSYTGIEYDTLTGKIAQALYPQSNVIIGDFTRTNLPKNFFDAAIGNPPFSQTQVLNDPEYKSKRPMLHDYFFMKTIDRVKPGGIVVFVTSKGTMDKTSDKSRKYLADRANLLGAIRLPQTAFKDNAGTEVVTDVIFLQKRGEGIPENGVNWLSTTEIQTPQGPAAINEYFAANPAMVLGSHALTGSMYRANEYTVIPQEGVDIETSFAKAIENLPENISRPAQGSTAERALVQDRDFNPKSKKEGGLYLSDKGKLMQLEDGSGVELNFRTGSEGKRIALSPKQKKWLRDYVGVRDALKQTQYDQLNDGDWEKSLKALNKAYDAFVKEHGRILDYTTIERTDEEGNTTETKRFKNAALFSTDVEGALAYALESIKEDGSIEKGVALKERVLEKTREPEIKTTQDALFVSLNRLGTLDVDEVAKLAGTDRASVINDLGTSIYEAPGADWQLSDDYLSGNVVRKLREAEASAEINPKYKRNVDALLAVQPQPLGPTDITVRLGANWVPPSDIAQFGSEVLGDRMDVSYNPVLGSWSVDARTSSVSEWGFGRMSAADILGAVLNSRQIKLTTKDSDGKTYPDVESTEKANDIATKMRERFRTWVWTDTDRADRLVKYYNENFNNIAPRKFDGSHLTLPGVSSRFKLYPHQKRAVWRVVQQGDTYLAHAVGAGKTMEMIAAGMEERRLGLVQKPMYVVPNHMLAQFSREFLELYPAANIMVADEQNFGASNRKRFVAQAALNNPDAIVITHSAFGRIGMSEEFSTKFINDQIDTWKSALEDVDKGDRITTKQIERRIEQLERRLEGKQGKERKDNVLTFEELGVDRLYVDEFHKFRKLDFATNQGTVKGITPDGSQGSLDLMMKVQYLRDKKPGRSLVAASGTPVTNTMGELFTAQRFFQPEQLKEDGTDTFDAWSAQYGDIVTGFEQNAAGGYEMVARFAKFQNVPELMRRVRSFMDILTSSNLGELVIRPDVVGGGRKIKVTPVPDGYKEYQQELQRRIQAIRNRRGPPKKGDDIILKVITDGRFSAIDMRFVDPSRPSDPNSKLNIWIDDIVAAYKETANNIYMNTSSGKPDPIKGSSILGFSNIGLGEASATNRGFDMKAWILTRLKEAGIPADQVAFMRDFKESAKKERLFADMREGKKRILIGGEEMETGTNVQKRLTHLFHLDAPWYPASVEQREGRIIRQGNQNKVVDVDAYATKGSYDSTMWGMNARKARFIEQAMNGDDSVRSLDDVSEASAFEMAAALASGDERYLKLAGLKTDVDRLERLRHAHYQEQNTLRRDKHAAEDLVKNSEKRSKEYSAAIAKRTPIKAGEFAGKVGKSSYDSREEFSQALFNAAKKLGTQMYVGEEKLGEVGGFDITYFGMDLKGGNYGGSLHVDVPGDPEPLMTYPVDPAMSIAGMATRAANQVNGLDREVERAQTRMEEGKRRAEQIGKRLGAAFPEEAILMEKVAELNALEAELAAEGEAAKADAAAATQEIEGKTDEASDYGEGEVRYSVAAGETQAEFGPVYTGLPAKDAIDRLMNEQTGEAIVPRAGLGDVSLVYGNDAAGLAHIAARRGSDIMARLPDLLQKGKIYTKEGQAGRVFIGNNRDEAALRLDWNGAAKTWLVSAYEKYPDLNEAGDVRESRRADVVAERTQEVLNKAGLRNALNKGVIGSVLNAMADAGVLVLHDTGKTLPKGVRNVRGVQAATMPDGTIHMVASALNPQNAQAVLLHEAFHNGAERLIGGTEWGNLMGRMGSLYRQSEQSTGKAREFFDKARARVAAAKRQGAVSTRMEVEEFAAYAIEEYESAPAAIRKWVDDLIGMVKAWMVKRFGKQLGQVTPAQLSALAKMAVMDMAADRRGDMFGRLGTLFSAADPISTPAFKNWFGKSKVADASGKPIVVYHGTQNDVTEFSEEFFGEGDGNADWGDGFYFASNPAAADTYADGEGGNVMPVYLAIQNPANKKVMMSRKVQNALGDDMGFESVRDVLEGMGYDGIAIDQGEGGMEYVVFRPEQIKSAIGSNGDFDPTNPDIRYSVTPEQGDKAIDAASEALSKAPKDDYIGRVVGDVGLSARLLVHPRQMAAIHPEFTPVYRTAISQMETRDTHIAELGRDVAAYDGLTQEGKENVNKALELGRLMSNAYSKKDLIEGVANTGERTVVSIVDGKPVRAKVPVTALLSGAGEVVRLSEQEASAYADLRKMFDRALDMMRNQTLEEMGYGELADVPNAAKAILATVNKDTPPETVERIQNIAKFISEIEQAKRAGYVPFARYGDYVVTVKEKVAEVKYIEDDKEHLIAQGLPDSFADSMLDMGAEQTPEGWRIKTSQKQDVERLTEKTVYSAKVETGLKDFMSERKAANVEQIPAVKEAIEKARKEYVAGNPNRRIVAFKAKAKKPNEAVKLSDVDALAEVSSLDNGTWDMVRDALADAIKAQGFRRHFFHSDNVPGYTGDFERSVADYVIGMSGYLSRRQHMKQWDRSVSSITAKPKLFEYASQYRDYVNDPQEELAMVRQIGFFAYIAGVAASAFANLTQVPFLTVPTLTQVAPIALVMKEVAKAYKEAALMMGRPSRIGLDMFDPNKAPADVREAIKSAWDEGVFVPLESFDLMMTARQRNVGRRKLVKGFNTTSQAVAIAFTFAERMNRLVTFIAASRLANKRAVQLNANRVLAGDALASSEILGRNWNARNFAEWAVDESQFRMGKANRPNMMRGVGSAIMQFKGFLLQTFEAWYRMAALHGKEGKFAAASSVMVLYAFAGLWGLPGADDLRKLLEALYKQITGTDLDMKTELRTWIAQTSGSNALAQIVNKGLTYPTGLDLTRVGLGSIVPDSALSAAGIPFDMLIGRPKRAIEKATAGDELGAVAELTPNFVKHWLVAGGWAFDGVRDKRGNLILSKDDLSGSDIAMKAFGFQPSIVTDVRDYEYAQRRSETAVDGLKRSYTAKLARAMASAEGVSDPQKLREIDQQIEKIYADISKHNETATPEQFIKIGNTALRNRIMRELDGVKSTWGRERKNARGTAGDLRGVFGLSEDDD